MTKNARHVDHQSGRSFVCVLTICRRAQLGRNSAGNVGSEVESAHAFIFQCFESSPPPHLLRVETTTSAAPSYRHLARIAVGRCRGSQDALNVGMLDLALLSAQYTVSAGRLSRRWVKGHQNMPVPLEIIRSSVRSFQRQSYV